jgi:hypothetical protein
MRMAGTILIPVYAEMMRVTAHMADELGGDGQFPENGA